MNLPRLLVIANVRGAARERRFAAVLAALGRLGAQVDVVRVDGPGDAARHARAAVAGNSGVERLVVAGGDGTMNDAVNGLDGATLPVAFLPLGTANVLAQELALPRHPDALARVEPLRVTDEQAPCVRLRGRLEHESLGVEGRDGGRSAAVRRGPVQRQPRA